MPHDGFPYADENTPGNFAYKPKIISDQDIFRGPEELIRLRKLVVELSRGLGDEGADWSEDVLHRLRAEVATVLPEADLPDWLRPYRVA